MSQNTIIVPVSGGKDSQVVLSMALEKARDRVVAVHQNTGYDHPDTYATITEMEKFYGVPIEHTRNKWGGMFPWLESSAGYFPNSAARGCTQRLKQEPFARWLVDKNYTAENAEIWFGMRSDESKVRASKYGDVGEDDVFTLGDIASFYTQGWRRGLGEIRVRLPIVSWNTEQIFAYIEAEGAPLNPLYGRGHLRVGCYPCFLGRKAEWAAAGKDPIGQQHIQKLVDLEDRWDADGNRKKFIKVHRTWDVRNFIASDPDAEAKIQESPEAECGYCSI
jgi:3'-phosphoadenosine 5'-phosphosulfate sulfotransferase (PAPS reductase)/FAD synthetase